MLDCHRDMCGIRRRHLTYWHTRSWQVPCAQCAATLPTTASWTSRTDRRFPYVLTRQCHWSVRHARCVYSETFRRTPHPPTFLASYSIYVKNLLTLFLTQQRRNPNHRLISLPSFNVKVVVVRRKCPDRATGGSLEWYATTNKWIQAPLLLLIIFINQYMADMRKNNNDTINEKII